MIKEKGGNKMRSFLTFITLFILLGISVNSADFDATKQNSGIVVILEGNSATLTLDGDNEYTLKVEKVSGRSVLASVDGRVLNLEIGQEREYDLNNDGTNDAFITLNNIIDKLVSFRIQKLVTPTPAEEAGTADVGEEEAEVKEAEKEDTEEAGDVDVSDEETEEEAEEDNEITGAAVGATSGLGRWVIGGVIVIIIIIVIAFVMSGGNNVEKNYEKAMDLHREGQEFHYDGDDDTARELYDKAGELREKARKMEGGF